MQCKELADKLADRLLPDIKEMYESYLSFDHFFKNIRQIIYLENCDIESEKMPNTAQSDGLYHNQKILQFVYKNRVVNFDLIDGNVLSEDFSILPNSGEITTIYLQSEELQNLVYSEEELLEQLDFAAEIKSNLTKIQYRSRHLDDENFKKMLQEEYNVDFVGEIPFIKNDKCKHFLYVYTEDKRVEFTGEVSFLKNNEWQSPIMLESELNKINNEEGGE